MNRCVLMARGLLAVLVSMVCVGGVRMAAADCPPGYQTDFPDANSNSTVRAMVTFDDGSGPALYAAGDFTLAGGETVARIGKYDGHTWKQLGEGLNNSVYCMTVFDDGTGPHLFVGGAFSASGANTLNRIAKWNGTAWQQIRIGTNIGVSNIVNALVVHNGQLVAGGSFTTAGGVAAAGVASWNGTTWTPLASGFVDQVTSLASVTLAGQPRLIAGGLFTASGTTVNLRNIAQWNGTAWSALGAGFTGTNSRVNAVAFFGGSLYAAGTFSNSGAASLGNIARWTGTVWQDVGGGLLGSVYNNALSVLNDGTGDALFVGGNFTTAAGGTITGNRFIKWNGTAWVPTGGVNSDVYCFTVYNDGYGSRVWLGGVFTTAGSDGTLVYRVAKWNGTYFSSTGKGTSATVRDMAQTGTGAAAKLVVVGDFDRAGGLLTSGVSTYNGSAWTSLGAAAFDTNPTCVADNNGTIYIGGNFSTYNSVATARFARWNGTTWTQAGTVNSTVNVMRNHNGQLYIGGAFSVPTGRVARYDGTTLTALGAGVNSTVLTMASYNNRLIVGGQFTLAGTTAVNRVAQWDGTNWSAMGNGVNNTVRAMAVFNGTLFVAGDFTTAGTGPASRVAQWNGTAWSDAGGGMDASVQSLAVIAASGHPQLYAIGTFVNASGSPCNRIARWVGCRWEPVGDGFGADPFFGPTLTSLASVETGPAAGMYVGGNFSLAGGVSSNNLARIALCSDCAADFDDGSGQGVPDGGVTLDDLLYYLVLYANGDTHADLDDGSGTRACDGGVTLEDLLYFLDRFAAGC